MKAGQPKAAWHLEVHNTKCYPLVPETHKVANKKDPPQSQLGQMLVERK
jgi:hypothetical protein